MVGHLQATVARKLGGPVLARRLPADCLLGLGRVLAGAWQQARSHALELNLRRACCGPIGFRSNGEDRVAHSRHRAGPDWLGAQAGPQQTGGSAETTGSHESVSAREPILPRVSAVKALAEACKG